MEDKVYILSDGSEETVAPEDEAAFQAELKENNLTATLKSDESGNQTSSTEDASAEQNTTASNQEMNQSQNNQQQTDTDSNLEDGSSESVDPNDFANSSYVTKPLCIPLSRSLLKDFVINLSISFQ